MAKLTIEIDMEDPQETWDALYRRIEQFGESDEKPKSPGMAVKSIFSDGAKSPAAKSVAGAPSEFWLEANAAARPTSPC